MIIIESGLLEEVRVSAAIEQFKRRNHDKFRGQQNFLVLEITVNILTRLKAFSQSAQSTQT